MPQATPSPGRTSDLRRRAARLALLAPLLAGLAPLGAAPPAPADEDWIRLTPAEGAPAALQTAVGVYRGDGPYGPVTVELVGAVHVGDAAYYRTLNERFRGYDAVLYELVAPEGTRVRRGAQASNDNPLGALQNGMKALLGLDHQLERIDYTRANLVHADMSPEELFESMSERGEGLLPTYFRLLGQSIAHQTKQAAAGESAEIDLLKAFFSSDRERQLKIAMAKQMAQMEGLLSGFGGEQGSAIIHQRNRVALEGLSEQLAAGRDHVAVFYGAGHLGDMDTRLRSDFGLRQTAKEWLTAWDLAAR